MSNEIAEENAVGQITQEKPKKHKIMTSIDDELWNRLWNLIKRKYTSPWRAMANTVREALIEYLDRHEKEYQ